MGNAVASEENKQWALEHVLFFDPETRPDPDAVLDERGGGSGGRVKRFTPSNAKLCNRNFLIRFTVEGKKREFILKMQNQPQCRLLLSDKAGEPIKEIRTSKIKYVQKQNITVEVYVRTGLQETSSLSFEFENAKECDLFAEFLRMLFGIQVHHFGYRDLGSPQNRQNKDPLKSLDSDESSSGSSESSDEDDLNRRRKMELQRRRERQKALQNRTGCPVHGDKPCRCTIERPTLSHQGGGAESSEEDEEVEASHTDQFPVAVEGLCEAGSTVRMKDLAARLVNRAPPRVVEWFFSHRPGKSPTFPTTPEKTGPACRLEESQVGCFLQLRVARRIENTSAANPFVYSLALKGPITVGSETARGMLEILSETETEYPTTLTNENLHYLFELPAKSVANTRPFFDCALTLTRFSTKFVSRVREFDQPLYREIPWAYFYVSRPEEVDYREDDLSLCFHIMNYSARTGGYLEKVVTLRLPSQGVRDFVFHTIVFFRLSKKVTAFERCSRDLETSNFTPIKQRYARLWAENSWEDYCNLPLNSVPPAYAYPSSTPQKAGGGAGYQQTPGYPPDPMAYYYAGGKGGPATPSTPSYPSPQSYHSPQVANANPYYGGGAGGGAGGGGGGDHLTSPLREGIGGGGAAGAAGAGGAGGGGGGGLAPPSVNAGRGAGGRGRTGDDQKSNYSVYAQYMNQGFGGVHSIIGQVDQTFQAPKAAAGRGAGGDGAQPKKKGKEFPTYVRITH